LVPITLTLNAIMVHGTSTFATPEPKLVKAGEFYDFAPASCVCYGCCVSEAQKKRTFVRAYDNRLEMNLPIAPCLCFCDDEKYMVDQTYLYFYDKPPFRTGMCCYVVPVMCFGPPVLFSYKPKCCCFDLSSCYGEQIMTAPCNFGNLKTYLCCGNPCYVSCSRPVISGMKDADGFLASLKAALNPWADNLGIPKYEQVIFASVSDNVMDFGAGKGVKAATLQKDESVEAVVMNRA